CPTCGGISIAPLSPPPAAPPPASYSPSPPPSAAGTVRFDCSCGQALQARLEHAGRSVRCPACRTAVVVPGGAAADCTAVRATPPPLPAGGPPPLSVPVPLAGQRPPRERGRRRAVWPFVLVGSVGLLVLVGVVLAVFLLRGSS